MNKYEKVLGVLKETMADVNRLLNDPEDENHRMKLVTELQRSHDFLALVTVSGDAGQGVHEKFGPAKTIGGKKIEYKANTKPEDVKPDEFKVGKLKDKVESLFASFLTIDTEDLLKNYEDIVIRGVAKKAKMKVTKDSPEKLTIDFIDEIKLEIMTEQERQAKLVDNNPNEPNS